MGWAGARGGTSLAMAGQRGTAPDPLLARGALPALRSAGVLGGERELLLRREGLC